MLIRFLVLLILFHYDMGIADFSGAIVTVVCLIAILPYIALQLKAISESFILFQKLSQVLIFLMIPLLM